MCKNLDYADYSREIKPNDRCLYKRAQRVSTDHSKGYFSGYASVYNQLDSHHDVVVKGAFANSVVSHIPILWQHIPECPIGYCIQLKEDNYGLYIEGLIVLSAMHGSSAYELIKSSAIGGLSIGYDVKQSHYDDNGVRYLTDLTLHEISIVTFPANQDAGVRDVKSNCLDHSNLEQDNYSHKLLRSLCDAQLSLSMLS